MTKSDIWVTWYNFAKEKSEHLAVTPTDFREYIPQSSTVQNLYNLLVEQGNAPLDAAIRILKQVTSSRK